MSTDLRSNFLDAFRFLRDIALSGSREAVLDRRRGGVTGIRSLAARRYGDVKIAVQLENGGARATCRSAFHLDDPRFAP